MTATSRSPLRRGLLGRRRGPPPAVLLLCGASFIPWLLISCAPAPVLDRVSGPAVGYYPLVVDTAALDMDAAAVTGASLGGIRVAALTPIDADTLEILVQGGPHSVPLDLVLRGEGFVETLPEAFTYDPPLHPAFERAMSFGASLTQGVSDATPRYENQLTGPSLALARQLGGWVPQPLLIPGLFPRMGPDTVGPPPDCRAASARDFIVDSLSEVAERLRAEGDGPVRLELGRVDPFLPHGNIAAGNFRIRHILRPPANDFDEIVPTMLGHLAFDPFAGIGDPLLITPIDILEAERPGLIFSTDFFGNDGLGGSTPVDEVCADMEELVRRLAATDAQVFLADLPRLSVLPGNDGSPEQDAAVAGYNACLRAEADRFANVYVVPFAARVEEVDAQGIELEGELLTTGMLGGLLSLDGLHFSATGYGLMAGVFVETINEALGTDVPMPDMATIMAADPDSPAALRAIGLDPEACR